MKKFLFMAAALVAMASCSNNDYFGDSPTEALANGQVLTDGINFGFDVPYSTRAGDLVGSDAATKLNNKFIVYGTKHESAEDETVDNDKLVFKNYVVEYSANTAGKTASNTQNWDYVGKTPYASGVSPTVTSQDIKYWDYSAASGYTFYAFAADEDLVGNKVTVTKTTTGSTVYDKGYSVVVKNGADLNKMFVADRKPVAYGNFGMPVTLKFRNFGTRVRVGFYETIPGYSVKIKNFYVKDGASAVVTSFDEMTHPETTFAASLQNIKTNAESNTLNVTYFDNTDASVENQVKVTPSPSVTYNYSLALGNGVVNTTLKEDSAEPTWDKAGGAYTTVMPFTATAPMLIKVDYTLTALDGSGETIDVVGANAVVPTQYVNWKSNFAYTYIFKIAPNTNGSTGGGVVGLYPITFDAVVVDVTDDKTQETITTFAQYSITTYANGSEVTTNDEYKAGETIYIVKTNNASSGAVVAPTAIGPTYEVSAASGNVQVYKATTTGDAISEATVLARMTGSPNGITLTATTSTEAASIVADGKVPAADDTKYNFGAKGAVQFTPSPAAEATYVYVFARTPYVAPSYTAVGEDAYNPLTTYYFKTSSDVYYTAGGIDADNFATYKGSLFTKTGDGTPGEYDIKVIKVNP